MESFGIQIEDGSEVVSDFAQEQNTSFMQLHDWQRRAINFFFENDFNAIYEVATGCLTGDTLIDLPRNLDKYPWGISIKDLVDKKDFYTYSFNIENQKIELNKVKNVWLNKKNVDVYEITLFSGKKIKATSNHPFLVDVKEKPKKGCGRGKREKIIGRKYVELKDLNVGDYLTTFNRSKIRRSDGEYIRTNYDENKRNVLEHRFILEQLNGKFKKHDIGHHKDENRFNNSISNLQLMDSREHNSYHTKKRGFFGKKLWEKNGHPKGFLGKKHTKETKENISLNTKLALNGKKYISTKKDYYSKEFLENGYNSYIYRTNKVESCKRCSETLKKRGKKFLSNRAKNNGKIKYSDKIINIKYFGKEDVYDMEVENNHNFIANGIIVHNSGKTYCAIEIIRRVLEKDPDVKILIVVPKNIIMETGWCKEFYDFGFTPVDVGVFYGNIKEYGRKITITNMQNLDRIAIDMFNFIVFDEVHNYGTTRLLPFVNRPVKYKLGLSATLERMDNKHYEIMKMFNYNIFKYTPMEALSDGVLNPFNFINIAIEMDDESYDIYNVLTQEINSLMQAGGGYSRLMRGSSALKMKMLSKMNERKDLVNNYHRKFDIIKMICEKYRGDKAIIFNEYNKQTTKGYWYLLDIGVKACIVHSDIPKDKREQNIMDFKNDKYNVMLASKVLDEGYNLPKIDTAIIAAGNSTSRQTIQRMGRVLRKKEKHSKLFQIYCKGTIEEDYSYSRAKLFKDLCSEYKEVFYGIKGMTGEF